MNRNSIALAIHSFDPTTNRKTEHPRACSGKVGKKTIYTLRWVLLRFLAR